MQPDEQIDLLDQDAKDTEEDRLCLYVQVLENVKNTKALMHDSLSLLKDYPEACAADTLILLRNASKEMRIGVAAFLNKLSESVY